MAELTGITFKTVKVRNHDVAGSLRRMNRFVVEAHKAVSADNSQVNEFDVARQLSYLNAADTYLDWANSQPLLDLPETSPMDIDVTVVDKVEAIENESLADIITLWLRAMGELASSQSARQSSAVISFDYGRVKAIITKTRNFLSDYVAMVTPLDLPESSPGVVATGTGRTGI